MSNRQINRDNAVCAVPLLLGAMLLASCSGSGSGSGDCNSGKCDDPFDRPDRDVPETVCDSVVDDHSGRGLGRIIGRLHDPLAMAVFREGECPTNFADIMTKLRAEGTDACAVDTIQTAAVSETAQILDMPTSYRTVTSVTCGDPNDNGQPPGVFFSLFGVSPSSDLPRNVEMIAFDEASGMFNYYETDGRTINFFGTSADMLEGKGTGDTRRCAACHVGGGLIMKELDAPWLHWEGDTTTPGAEALIADQPLLGRHGDGIDLEFLVRDGNVAWNRNRAARSAADGTLKQLLRPVFCGGELNVINSGATVSAPDEGVASFANLGGAVISRKLGFRSVELSPEQYDAVIRANGQRIGGLPAGFIETHFPLTQVIAGEADLDYAEQLVETNIVDDRFIDAVLAVDMTRPVFSDDRCGALDLLPDAKVSEIGDIHTAVVDHLRQSSPAPGSVAAELLNNLADPRKKIGTRVKDFFAACEARSAQQSNVAFEKDGQSASMDVSRFLIDYMEYTSLLRDQAREQPVFEFPQTMPDDDLNVPADLRFHPASCELTTEFVAVAEAFDPDSSCFASCGTSSGEDGKICGCDSACESRGDCCTDHTAECVRPDCSHSVCELGIALEDRCIAPDVANDCVERVCANDTFCCEQEWDASCLGAAQSMCGASCGPECTNGSGDAGDCCINSDSGLDGVCIDTSVDTCVGNPSVGDCPSGPANVRCCAKVLTPPGR